MPKREASHERRGSSPRRARCAPALRRRPRDSSAPSSPVANDPTVSPSALVQGRRPGTILRARKVCRPLPPRCHRGRHPAKPLRRDPTSSFPAGVELRRVVVDGDDGHHRPHAPRQPADYYPLLATPCFAPAFQQEDLDRLRSRTLNQIENQLRFASDEEQPARPCSTARFSPARPTAIRRRHGGVAEGHHADDVKVFYARTTRATTSFHPVSAARFPARRQTPRSSLPPRSPAPPIRRPPTVPARACKADPPNLPLARCAHRARAQAARRSQRHARGKQTSPPSAPGSRSLRRALARLVCARDRQLLGSGAPQTKAAVFSKSSASSGPQLRRLLLHHSTTLNGGLRMTPRRTSCVAASSSSCGSVLVPTRARHLSCAPPSAKSICLIENGMTAAQFEERREFLKNTCSTTRPRRTSASATRSTMRSTASASRTSINTAA